MSIHTVRPDASYREINPSTADRVYAQVKADIVVLRLRPGAMLDESRLAQQHGVSRTPIREALRRLEQDGLVVTVPRRGSFVTAPTAEDLLEVDQVRLLLEPFAARLAAGRVDAGRLAEFEVDLGQIGAAEHSHEQVLAFLRVDSDLHELVLAAAGNRHLCDIVVALHNKISSVRLASSARRIEAALQEHHRLIAALRAADADGAEQAMREHLRSAFENRSRLFVPGRGATAGQATPEGAP